MCCKTESHHGCRCGCCGCGGHSRFGPTFWTKEEKIVWVEEYLEDLQAETKAVEERIAALKGEE